MKAKTPLCIVFIIFYAFSTLAYAEDQPRNGEQHLMDLVDQPRAVGQHPIQLEWTRGTLGSLSKLISKMDMNIYCIMSPEVEKIEIPGFRLRFETKRELYDFLRSYGQHRFILEWAGDNEDETGKSFWVFKSIPKVDLNASEGRKPTARPISVMSLVGSLTYTIEQITTAIQHTVDAFYAANGEKPQPPISFQYHKDTYLLIVSGESQAVDLAEKTIDALRQGLQDSKNH
jgi:hypothetical protein